MRISADVILRGRGGHSLAEAGEPVTAERVDAFRPDEGDKAAVRRALEARGFEVQDAGLTLAIAGEPQLFERELGVRLDVNPDPAPGEAVATAADEPQVPEEVRALVEAIAFPRRAHLFGSPATREERHGQG